MMRTMASAVYMADILLFLMEKSVPAEHIHAAFWHNFANGAQELFSIQTTEEYNRVLGEGRTWKGRITDEGYGVRMPIYWVFSLLSKERGDEVVRSELHAADNRIAAPANGLYWDPEFHFGRVSHCVTKSGSKLYVAVLNKDAHRTVDLGLRIRGWRVTPRFQRHWVGAASYLAENSMADPNCIALSGPEQVTADDRSNVRLRLDPNTLMVLRFQRAAPQTQ
jgi:hypothetical protein